MSFLTAALVALLVLPSCLCVHDLDAKYSSRKSLHPRYTLYWNYNPTLRNISFAVRVQTTGWVGLGISPNGGMVGSDVIIGGVQNGSSYFNDRFAVAESTPPVDIQQDWFLINAEEENGYTTLEFTRNYTSCDDNGQDRNITSGTLRIVWSLKNEDPPNGVNGSFIAHDLRGSASVNLLGGLRNAIADPPGTKSFTLRVNQITIPSADTTYWCAGFELPQEIQNNEKYMIRYSPYVTVGNTAHVHHMVVYTCDSLNTTDPGGPCDDVSKGLSSCLEGIPIAAWGVGGPDFVFPSNVALAFGGDHFRYVLIQMHYDNPYSLSGVKDSSGMKFYYIDTPRQHISGLLTVGHDVNQYMVIPPKARNYTIYGFCSAACTEHFPEEGIHVFANMLHTHLLGVSIKLYHLRASDQCRPGGGIEELKPIDNNPYYDFNFQEVVHIDEVIVKQGDILMLACTYDSTNRNSITLGGESTHEEMCLSVLSYYPRVGFAECLSSVRPEAFKPFLSTSYNAAQLNLSRASGSAINQALNQINWLPHEIQQLEDILLASNQSVYCYGPGIFNETIKPVPSIGCPYESPPVMLECPDSVVPTSGAAPLHIITVFTVMIMMMVLLMI